MLDGGESGVGGEEEAQKIAVDGRFDSRRIKKARN